MQRITGGQQSSPEINVASRIVGAGQPVLVIAEIGVNHDGSLDRALELVAAAAAAGADAVKLQIFHARTLMHQSGQFAEYQKNHTSAADPIEMLSRYELSAPALLQVVEAIVARGLIPLATPFSLADVKVIQDLQLPAIKIASPDLVNRPLLLQATQTLKPLLLSTGAANATEIDTTVGWLRKWESRFALLHCVSSYPVPADQTHLCWIKELSGHKAPVGYSDHSTELLTGALAVTAGACIIEKHLTYDRTAVGPDHATSADPDQFTLYVQQIRRAERLRGFPGKRVLEIEQDVRRVSRQSLVLLRDLQSGDTVRADNLGVQRPGTGIPAAMSDRVIGRKLVRPIPAGTMLQWDMLHEIP